VDLKTEEKMEYLLGEKTVQRMTHAQMMARLQYPHPEKCWDEVKQRVALVRR
jgi:hypothetical protein